MTYRTAFTVRADYDDPHIDGGVTWPDVDGLTIDELEKAAKVAARVTGDPVEVHPAVKAAHAVQHWDLRMRLNRDIEGVFLVITDEPPTDEELIAWWKLNRKTAKKVRL